MQMSTSIINIASCIAQVTLETVNCTLLIKYLVWSRIVGGPGQFSEEQIRLDCGLERETKVFQLRLDNASGILILKRYDYTGFPP